MASHVRSVPSPSWTAVRSNICCQILTTLTKSVCWCQLTHIEHGDKTENARGTLKIHRRVQDCVPSPSLPPCDCIINYETPRFTYDTSFYLISPPNSSPPPILALAQSVLGVAIATPRTEGLLIKWSRAQFVPAFCGGRSFPRSKRRVVRLTCGSGDFCLVQ